MAQAPKSQPGTAVIQVRIMLTIRSTDEVLSFSSRELVAFAPFSAASSTPRTEPFCGTPNRRMGFHRSGSGSPSSVKCPVTAASDRNGPSQKPRSRSMIVFL